MTEQRDNVPTDTPPPARSQRSSPQQTRVALLDAAERLLGERGIGGASLRAITQEAHANLAAVNYHFGSKHGLILAVLQRRFGPTNERRLERLAQIQAEHSPGERLESIVRAFVSPAMEMLQEHKSGPHPARLVGRLFSQPTAELHETLIEAFAPIAQAFLAALADELPTLSQAQLMHRFHFMVGAMLHTAANSVLVKHLAAGSCDAGGLDEMADELIQFLTAGFAAPAPSSADANPNPSPTDFISRPGDSDT